MAATTSCRLRQEQCSRAHQLPEREVVEMALAHAVGDKVEAAYRRGDLFEKWRRLMAEWASYCNRPAASGRDKVVRMRVPGKRERRDKRSAVLLSGSSTPTLGAPVGSGWKEWSISLPLDTGSNSFTPLNRSVRSCSQPQRRDRRGRVPRLRNSQDDIGAGAPVQFSPVPLLQLQLQRRHSPPHGFWRQNRSERHPDWASPL